MTMPLTDVVPYQEARPETRAAYLAGLHDQRGLDGNPEAWTCGKCGTTTAGDDILISWRAGGVEVTTPIPYCPANGCDGYGPDLNPAS